jgi:hypothetical protein
MPMNPIFDLWGDYMLDLQLLWFLVLPLVLIGAGITTLLKKKNKK